MIESIRRRFESEGLSGLLRGAGNKVIPRKLLCYHRCLPLFEGKVGLEIGGPSSFFGRRGLFPAYRSAEHVDNCNFHNETTWEGTIARGNTFLFDKKRPPGHQYIGEAGQLPGVMPNSYDFILSSHMLEHTANPLLALSEWMRVLKPQGALLLVVPHKDGTFDHRRPTTPLDHLIEDFERRTGEDDLTHLPEILELHDIERDSGAGDFAAFKARSEQNLKNRCLHQHVFDTRLMVQVVDRMRLQILAVEAIYPCHIVVISTKPPDGQTPDNQAFLSPGSGCYKSSPFRSDALKSGK